MLLALTIFTYTNLLILYTICYTYTTLVYTVLYLYADNFFILTLYIHYTYTYTMHLLYTGAVATLATRLLSLNREDFQTVTKVYKSNLYKEVQLMLYSNRIFARMNVDCLLRIASW